MAGHPNGRNFRNADLWFQSVAAPHGLVGFGDELVGLDVTSEAFKGCHFAVMPPALVEPCVKAGTSERGCCPKCGDPWVRVVERQKNPRQFSQQRREQETARTGRRDGKTDGPDGYVDMVTTIGWEPSCECGEPEIAPCLILDPFAGACTTGLVAQRLGRRFVGVELNPEYAEMGRKRLRDDMPLFQSTEAP